MINSEQIKQILIKYQRLAVVGLSPDRNRPSFGVTAYMIDHGYEVVGIRPGVDSILGRPCYASLAEAPPEFDIINVFRQSDAVPEIVDQIEKLMKSVANPADRPKVLWLQEGVTHPEAEERARKLGLEVIANRCILKEHHRIIG